MHTTAPDTEDLIHRYLVNEWGTTWCLKHAHQMGRGAFTGHCTDKPFLHAFFWLRITETKENDMRANILYFMFLAKEVTEKRVWIPTWETFYSVVHKRYDRSASSQKTIPKWSGTVSGDKRTSSDTGWKSEFIELTTVRQAQWLRATKVVDGSTEGGTIYSGYVTEDAV